MNIKFLVVAFAVVAAMVVMSGCIEESNKKAALDAISPIVVMKGSEQYCIQFPAECNVTPVSTQNTSYVIVETPTPLPTPTVKPTVSVEPVSTFHYIDPFDAGERWEGQWFKWQWPNASGRETANRGIIIYGHSYYDSLTYWDAAWGNYQPLTAPAGQRFLAVYMHEEEFGPDSPDIWGYDYTYFKLWYYQGLNDEYTGYNKIYRIVELEDRKNDYYNIDRLRPFGMVRTYHKGREFAATGGYTIEKYIDLRKGQGNSWDGYILFTVPKTVNDNDIRIVGNFANKNVYWRFGNSEPQMYSPEMTEKIDRVFV
jgi:hypothetical protein